MKNVELKKQTKDQSFKDLVQEIFAVELDVQLSGDQVNQKIQEISEELTTLIIEKYEDELIRCEYCCHKYLEIQDHDFGKCAEDQKLAS
ncbi:MAG: hypothetical protein ACPGJV_02585 [Bacteriovoracaceae bacterium]